MISLKNKKVFFLPVNTGYNDNGEPNDRLINFYKKRSGNGIYCSIVGNVVTPLGFGSNRECVFISKNKSWSVLADTISSNGSIPGIQLSTVWEGYIGMTSFVAHCKNDFDHYYEIVKNTSKPAIDMIFEDFKNAADLAILAGFKHIQIHAAHGYLMSLIIDEYFCDNHLHAISKLNDLISYINKNEIETSIRFSLKIGMQEIDKKRNSTISNILSINSSFHDISFGFYNINKNMIYPQTNSMLKSRFNACLEIIKKNNKLNFILSGKSLKNFSDILPQNTSVGICRDLIANPNYLNDMKICCNDCGACHYHSLGKKNISCSIWEGP